MDESTDTVADSGRTPPYMSFETFKNFLLRLNFEDLPPRIDRSIMVGMAGGAQTTTLSTLREFGMVQGEDNTKTIVLDRFVQASEKEMEALFAELVRTYYAAELKLSDQKGTAAQLDELFGKLYGVTGSTRRKAVTFFLHAAKFGKLTLSPHFKAPRSAPAGKRTTKAKNTGDNDGGGAHDDEQNQHVPSPSNFKSKTIKLAGATVTLSYDADLFELDKADRDFILEMIDKLKAHEASSADSTSSQAPGDGNSA